MTRSSPGRAPDLPSAFSGEQPTPDELRAFVELLGDARAAAPVLSAAVPGLSLATAAGVGTSAVALAALLAATDPAPPRESGDGAQVTVVEIVPQAGSPEVAQAPDAPPSVPAEVATTSPVTPPPPIAAKPAPRGDVPLPTPRAPTPRKVAPPPKQAPPSVARQATPAAPRVAAQAARTAGDLTQEDPLRRAREQMARSTIQNCAGEAGAPPGAVISRRGGAVTVTGIDPSLAAGLAARLEKTFSQGANCRMVPRTFSSFRVG